MDDFAIHLAPEPRRFPGPPPIARMGFYRRKRIRLQQTFRTWNFSLILAGSGHYTRDGERYAVQGPCVLTQWPGAVLDYGPDAEGWTELYVIYAPETGDQVRRAGLWPGGRGWWSLADPGRFFHAVEVVLSLARSSEPVTEVDRLDRAMESAVIEARLAAIPAPRSGAEAAVAAIRAEIEADWRREHHFSSMAAARGLSDTHFRRLWQDMVGVPPRRHLVQIRLRQASRLLVQTTQSVAAIAAAVGYADPLHFSRSFRAEMGHSPVAYRTLHREPPGR